MLRRSLPFLALCILTLASASGCTTIYGAAVEERSLSTQLSDSRIKVKIIESFIADERVKAMDISAEAYDGHVYLVGEYDAPDQKDRAMKIARDTEGVKAITAHLLPKQKGSCGTSDNLAITAKVKAALIGDRDIFSTNVAVKTVQCEVVLLGIAGSKKEVNKAIAHAEKVEGVRKVTSYLKASKKK